MYPLEPSVLLPGRSATGVFQRYDNWLRLGLSFSAAAVVCTSAAVGLADPGPVGSEYAAEERELPGKAWWLECETVDGTTYRLTRECSDEKCKQPGEFWVTRSRGGASESARANTAPAAMTMPSHLTCHDSGWLVVQWVDSESRCYLHRVFDTSLRAMGDPQFAMPSGGDCRVRPDVALRSSGEFITAWSVGFWDDNSAIVARLFHADGSPASELFTVSDSSDGWRRKAKIAVDERGVALVTWSRAATDTPDRILARFIDVDGNPIGEEFQLNRFPYGDISDPVVSSEGGGVFEVLWSNWLEGGRVGRRASVDGAAATESTTTTTIPPPGDLPVFGATRTVDSLLTVDGTAHFHTPVNGNATTWLLVDEEGDYRRSSDDSASWSAATAPRRPEEYLTRSIGNDGGQIWIALHSRGYEEHVYFTRSDENAADGSWSTPAELGRVFDANGCDRCRIARSRLRGSSSGTWIAALGVAGRPSLGGGDHVGVGRIVVYRSGDRGHEWDQVTRLPAGAAAGAAGFALETDGTGTWVLLWADTSLWVSTSHDDGRTWNDAEKLADDVVCSSCKRHDRYSRLELATDGAGAWVAVFASPGVDVERFGVDADVFSVSSRDNAVSWSLPAAIDRHASGDGARDADPTIATDASGRWLAAWTTHRPLGGGDGLDGDVVIAMSTDAGESWSSAVPLRPDSLAAMGLDWTPRLAADRRRVWLLSWNSRGLDRVQGLLSDRVLLTTAQAHCGDGHLDPGEQCDDSNRRDGDGCDSNCTKTGCGNGIVTTGEVCDDANDWEGDLCVDDCRAAICGDGIVQGIEECDDGNSSDSDDCPASCRWAVCGDGYVHAQNEQCDDGNDSNADACTNWCQPARCGDGYVQEGVEACDNGSRHDFGSCPPGCRDPVCGDGFTSFGFEECDPADPRYGEICTSNCELVDICGDANGDGSVTATDAQRIISRGVGLEVVCPAAACDMNGDRYVRASDAQMALYKAVGLPVGDRCSIGTGSIIFWIDEPGVFGSLQFAIDYSTTGGDFVGSGDAVACEPLMAGVVNGGEFSAQVQASDAGFVTFNDDDSKRLLQVAMIHITGFGGGAVDLVRCEFELPDATEASRFRIYVVDAAGADLEPPEVWPRVGYRLQ